MNSLSHIAQTKPEFPFFVRYEKDLYKKSNVTSEQKTNPLKIDKLLKYNLSEPLLFTLEPDADGFIAKCPDLPTLYGYGDDKDEAINNLKFEIDSLYEDLMKDDNFTQDWLEIKSFLQKRVSA